jgi:putative metallohydrolase (TIGR04338 family)
VQRPRDSQRKRVYDAERALFPDDRFPPHLTLPQAEALVGRIYLDARYRHLDRLHPLPPAVKDGRGRRRAGYCRARHAIALPRWARRVWVVAHEVAHALLDHNRHPGHGEEFVAVYLDVLERHVGMDAATLRHGFLTRGVRVATLAEEGGVLLHPARR